MVALLLALPTLLWAQPGKNSLNLKLEKSVYIREAVGEDIHSTRPYLWFPHLNDWPQYTDKKLRKAIDEAELAKDYVALDTLLAKMISNFGPVNFRTDLDLIWKAGQVREIMGDSVGALLFYEIGIKNQRPWHPKVRIHYDSLIERTNSAWVDLQFYYKVLEARREMDPLIPPKGVLLNMGPKVNSGKADYAPFMHPSDSILIFTSRRDEEIVIDDINPQKNEDLFIAQRDWISGTWTYAEKFSKSVNSPFNEGSSCLSRDGRMLVFARCDADDGMGSCDLYSAIFAGDDWTQVQNLGPNVNSTAWDSHPNLSPDGTMLFFTSNREGGFGKSDLYVSRLQPDGTWGKAENLGPVINTMDDEVTPFFHQINSTLYFSSTGHMLNIGGYDIFKSRLLEDHYEEPRNVGPLVNGRGNEYYFSIDGKGTRLFYAKSRDGDSESVDQIQQDFDLYSFPMPMEARPDAIYTLRGYLIDSASGNPITGLVLVIDRSEGVEVTPKFINKYGYFEFDLMTDKKYDIYIQGENFFTVHDEVVLSGDTTFTTIVKSFESGKPIVFEKLEFEENSYDLNSSIEPRLNYIAKFMHKYPMFRLEVKGHTDSDGDAEYNLDLSRKRSAQIRKYIIDRAEIDPTRVAAYGFGEGRPLVANDTEEHKRMNRRVEFEIWLDPEYKGEAALPTEEELFMDEEFEEIYDPEFMEEEDFNWDEEEEDLEWEETDDADLLREYDNFGLDVPDTEDGGKKEEEDLDDEE
jgi:flagellar motor protein MotB